MTFICFFFIIVFIRGSKVSHLKVLRMFVLIRCIIQTITYRICNFLARKMYQNSLNNKKDQINPIMIWRALSRFVLYSSDISLILNLKINVDDTNTYFIVTLYYYFFFSYIQCQCQSTMPLLNFNILNQHNQKIPIKFQYKLWDHLTRV